METMNDKIRFIGYICPKCGAGITGAVSDMFEPGKLIKLKCGDESELHLRQSGDGNISVEVPCVFCPERHIFTVSKERFFSDEFLSLYCKKTGYPVFLCGKQDELKIAMEESGRQLKKMLKEAGAESFEPLRESEKFDRRDLSGDAFEIEGILNFTLRELEEDGKIECGCDGRGEYVATVDGENGYARIRCEKCGFYKDYEMKSVSQAEEFINTDSIKLEQK